MNVDRPMRVGHIPFLNCVPFFQQLKAADLQGELVSGVPSLLNQQLQQGFLDVSPSSSFEYACNWQDYLILPGHAIASRGPVRSVLLFSPVPIEKLANREIMITGESATSINLLRVVLKEFYGFVQVEDCTPEPPIEEMINRHEPGLLIGDRALRQAEKFVPGMQIYDLGELWQHNTGYPFVFALWMIRRAVLDQFSEELKRLETLLWRSRRHVLVEPWGIAHELSAQVGLQPETIVDYWNTIDYDLGQEHLQGLQLFFDLCQKHRLLQSSPELQFYNGSSHPSG